MSFFYLAEDGAHTRKADSKLHRERSKISVNSLETSNRSQIISYPLPKEIRLVNPQPHLTTTQRSLPYRAPQRLPPQRVCPCQKQQ